jgi:hypothetical protein
MPTTDQQEIYVTIWSKVIETQMALQRNGRQIAPIRTPRKKLSLIDLTQLFMRSTLRGRSI